MLDGALLQVGTALNIKLFCSLAEKAPLTESTTRDKNSINKFQLGKVTAEGVSISEPFAVKTEWNLQAFQNPSRHVPGTW